jgi:hypothetical protein
MRSMLMRQEIMILKKKLRLRARAKIFTQLFIYCTTLAFIGSYQVLISELSLKLVTTSKYSCL